MKPQRASPPVRLLPSRIGVTGVEAVVHLGADQRSAQPFLVRLECLVEPGSPSPAAATTRVEEVAVDVVRDVVRDVVAGAAAVRAERLAQEVAERLRERRDARRAEVGIVARFPERRPAPESGTPTQEISTLHARAVASLRGTRRTVGVSAQGITTAPWAQAVLAARSRERLAADGFSEAQIDRVLDRVPVASHDQLGVGTLHLGCPEECALDVDVTVLLAIVEGAMSSEIFELMKRSDEAAVVERAHRRPRTVDECVRVMLAGVLEHFPDLPDVAFVSAAQDTMETIHGHHLRAERAGLLGDLRREVRVGKPVVPDTSMRRWLEVDGP